MKNKIDSIYRINFIAYLITLISYSTIFLGLISQLFLGIIQLIIGIGLLFYYQKLTIKSKRRVIYYWLIVISWLCISLLIYFLSIERNILGKYSWWIWMLIIPMSIATYQIYLIHKLKKELK